MSGRLFDKVAVVTGAGTGIGEAIALKFAQEGARLLLVGLPDDPVEDVARMINGAGGFAETYLGDIAEERHAEAAIEACVSAYGRIDVLVNNAGVFLAAAETQDYPIDKFDETLRANVRSVFLMTKFALPYLQKTYGNIISTGSEAGMIGIAKNTMYGGTKAFIRFLHARRGRRAGGPWGARQLRLPGPDRYGLDAQVERPDERGNGIHDDRRDAHGSPRHAGRGRECLLLPRFR